MLFLNYLSEYIQKYVEFFDCPEFARLVITTVVILSIPTVLLITSVFRPLKKKLAKTKSTNWRIISIIYCILYASFIFLTQRTFCHKRNELMCKPCHIDQIQQDQIINENTEDAIKFLNNNVEYIIFKLPFYDSAIIMKSLHDSVYQIIKNNIEHQEKKLESECVISLTNQISHKLKFTFDSLAHNVNCMLLLSNAFNKLRNSNSSFSANVYELKNLRNQFNTSTSFEPIFLPDSIITLIDCRGGTLLDDHLPINDHYPEEAIKTMLLYNSDSIRIGKFKIRNQYIDTIFFKYK